MPTAPETADTGKSDVDAPLLFKIVYLAIVVAVFLVIATALVHEATYLVEFVWRAT